MAISAGPAKAIVRSGITVWLALQNTSGQSVAGGACFSLMDTDGQVCFVVAGYTGCCRFDDSIAVSGLDVEIEVCCTVRMAAGAIPWSVNSAAATVRPNS